MNLTPASAERLAELRKPAMVMRTKREALLRKLATSEMTLRQALHARHAEVLGGIKVGRLVKRLPGWGPKTCHALLSELGIEPERRFRALGVNERAALIAALTK